MFWIGVWNACEPLINKDRQDRQVSQPGFYYLLPTSRFQLPTQVSVHAHTGLGKIPFTTIKTNDACFLLITDWE
jgi:hypothetical protein